MQIPGEGQSWRFEETPVEGVTPERDYGVENGKEDFNPLPYSANPSLLWLLFDLQRFFKNNIDAK